MDCCGQVVQSVELGANAFLCYGRLHHDIFDALLSPGDGLHFVVLGKSQAPQSLKIYRHTSDFPGAGVSESAFPHGIPELVGHSSQDVSFACVTPNAIFAREK